MTQTQRLTTGAILVLLLIVAAGLRFATFDRYLPLLDYSDESNMFLLALDMRGDEVPLADAYGAPLTGEWLAGYPPLFPWMSIWGGRLLEATSEKFLFPGDYIGLMRWPAVIANVLTVAVLFWLGWSLTQRLGEWAALVGATLTALPYAISAPIVDVGNLAIPDSFIPLACTFALLGAVRAIKQDTPIWLIWSLLGAIAAIYLKYSVLVGLWATFCGVVVLVRRRGLRPMLPWLGVLAAISAITAAYLVWGYGALGLENREANNFRETGLTRMLDPGRNWINLRTALQISTGTALFWGGLLLGVIGWGRAPRDRRLHVGWLALLVPFIAANILLTSSIVYADPVLGGYGRIRFVFPAAIALSAIWATGLAHWLTAERCIGASLATVAAALVILPAVSANTGQIREYARTDTNLLLWQYTDTSLPATGDILTLRESRTHLVWNRPYSGYTGRTFTWAHDEQPYQLDAADAYRSGVHYFVFTERDRTERLDTDRLDNWLADLTHLKTISAAPENVTGETTHVYQMHPPQQALDVAFGDAVRLVGYDGPLPTQAGETGAFRAYWNAPKTPDTNYNISVQVTPTDDLTQIIAQWDGPPVTEARLPVTWNDPDETLVGADIPVSLPGNVPPGDYLLSVILYNFETGARLPVGDTDRFTLPLEVR